MLKTFIETGWPTQGDSNGSCVPSPENQAAALASIKSAMGSDVCYFTAFDDNWKTDTPATFNAEKVCLILFTNVIIYLLTRILALGYQKPRLLSS